MIRIFVAVTLMTTIILVACDEPPSYSIHQRVRFDSGSVSIMTTTCLNTGVFWYHPDDGCVYDIRWFVPIDSIDHYKATALPAAKKIGEDFLKVQEYKCAR